MGRLAINLMKHLQIKLKEDLTSLTVSLTMRTSDICTYLQYSQNKFEYFNYTFVLFLIVRLLNRHKHKGIEI